MERFFFQYSHFMIILLFLKVCNPIPKNSSLISVEQYTLYFQEAENLDKKDKEELLNKKIEEVRRKNQEREKKFKVVLAYYTDQSLN